MSEEEQKAIEDLKTLKLGITFLNCFAVLEKDKTDIKAIDVVLNLIETQQKEIIKLKKDYSDMLLQEQLNNYISKDKIKEKIKKYDEWIKEGGDYVESLEAQRYSLNELLEE